MTQQLWTVAKEKVHIQKDEPFSFETKKENRIRYQRELIVGFGKKYTRLENAEQPTRQNDLGLQYYSRIDYDEKEMDRSIPHSWVLGKSCLIRDLDKSLKLTFQ